MKKKGLGAVAVAVMLVCGACIPTFAQADGVKKQGEEIKLETDVKEEGEAVTLEAETKKPKVKWSGTANLVKGKYMNITSSNNIFPDQPTVTNDEGNPGDVTFRIKNEKGEIVGTAKTAKPGKSVKMDKIPAFSGDYTLQGKATVDGEYTISID